MIRIQKSQKFVSNKSVRSENRDLGLLLEIEKFIILDIRMR